MTKRKSPDRPICFAGKIVFDFYNNEDEEFKVRSLKALAKEVRKEWNVSCVPIEEHEVENPERGVLALVLVGPNYEAAKAQLDKALAFFDGKAPARITAEDFLEAELE